LEPLRDGRSSSGYPTVQDQIRRGSQVHLLAFDELALIPQSLDRQILSDFITNFVGHFPSHFLGLIPADRQGPIRDCGALPSVVDKCSVRLPLRFGELAAVREERLGVGFQIKSGFVEQLTVPH